MWAVAPIWRYLLTSTIVAERTVLGVEASSTAAGFAFTCYRFPGRTVLFWLPPVTLMVPGQVAAVPP